MRRSKIKKIEKRWFILIAGMCLALLFAYFYFISKVEQPKVLEVRTITPVEEPFMIQATLYTLEYANLSFEAQKIVFETEASALRQKTEVLTRLSITQPKGINIKGYEGVQGKFVVSNKERVIREVVVLQKENVIILLSGEQYAGAVVGWFVQHFG